MDFTRLFEILEYQQQRYPQQVALAGRGPAGWHTIGTADSIAQRDCLSAGLLRAGLHKGDRIGILAHCGSPEWVIADAAMLQTGLVPAKLDKSLLKLEAEAHTMHVGRDAGSLEKSPAIARK